MRILLWPFSVVFRIIVYVRNKLYNLNYLKKSYLNSTVVSVGNVSSGGTGKTPMVEYLANYFLERNKSVNIVLKGYKRIYDDMQVAEFGFKDNEGKLNSENFGDEGLMLLENLPVTSDGKGLLIISDKKATGARFSDNKFKPDVIIIDDGFQLRKIKRELDVVMVNPYESKHLIPAGNMREPYRNIKRADIVVINRKFHEDANLFHKGNLSKAIYCGYRFEHFVNSKNEVNDLKDGNALVFCGIGDPESFKDLIKLRNINIAGFIPFADHYNFKGDDLKNLLVKYKESGADCILTTQKDFVRIKYSKNDKAGFQQLKNEILFNYPLYYAKIKLQISHNEEYLINKLNELTKGMH